MNIKCCMSILIFCFRVIGVFGEVVTVCSLFWLANQGIKTIYTFLR